MVSDIKIEQKCRRNCRFMKIFGFRGEPRERRQNILGPVSRHCLLRGGGGISKSAKVDAGGPKISQLIKFY